MIRKNEIYELHKDDLKDNGYKVIKFDFNNFNRNKWNPIKLTYDLYKDNNINDTVMILEKITYYMFKDSENDNSDPFWLILLYNYLQEQCFI